MDMSIIIHHFLWAIKYLYLLRIWANYCHVMSNTVSTNFFAFSFGSLQVCIIGEMLGITRDQSARKMPIFNKGGGGHLL